MSFNEIADIALKDFVFLIVRYTIMAGGAFFFFWILKRKTFESWKIQEKDYSQAIVKKEILRSLRTFAIFVSIFTFTVYCYQQGWTSLYDDFSRHSFIYELVSLILLLLLHDTYFYWTHRMLHHRFFYRWAHSAHHESTNPTPFTSFSFNAFEAFVQVLFLPLAAFLVPTHVFVFLGFFMISATMNTLGHLGYELYPKGFTRHKFFKNITTSTHHNMHHKFFNKNFGFYFTFWDKVAGTQFDNYEQFYDSVIEKRKPLEIEKSCPLKKMAWK